MYSDVNSITHILSIVIEVISVDLLLELPRALFFLLSKLDIVISGGGRVGYHRIRPSNVKPFDPHINN